MVDFAIPLREDGPTKGGQYSINKWTYSGDGEFIIFYGGAIRDRLDPLRIPEGPELYAAYKAYDFQVLAYSPRLGGGPFKVELTLAHGSGGAVLGWDPSNATSPFTVLHDPGGLVGLISGPSDQVYDALSDSYLLHFMVKFGWSWPTEDPCDVTLRMGDISNPTLRFHYEDIFRVVRSLEFAGPLDVQGQWQGPLDDGDWVRAGELLTFICPRVVYRGTVDVHPPSGFFNVTVQDDDGEVVRCQHVSGERARIPFTADPVTDREETYTIELRDLPGHAWLASERTIRLPVDGDPPTLGNPVPEGDDWHCANEVLVSITADDDATSGADASTLEYQFSTDGGVTYSDWTRSGLETTPDAAVVDGLVTLTLPDGADNYVRWRVKDLVGNGYTVSPDHNIKVDTRNVTYTDPYPTGWQRALRLECGVTVTDVEGSGIDVGSVQYRLSYNNLSHYGAWRDWDEGLLGDATSIACRVVVEFEESAHNYIQWRAMDIAGNGYTTSRHYWVGVDATPPVLVSFHPPADSKRRDALVAVTALFSDAVSGVDVSGSRYRFSPNGSLDICEWCAMELTRVADVWSLQMEVRCALGPGNRMQFTVVDVAGNSLTTDPRVIWVNRPPSAVIDAPVEGMTYSSDRPIVLDASGSEDPDGDEVFFRWCLDGSDEPVAFCMTSTVNLAPGEHTLVLVAYDIDGAEDRTDVDFSVERPPAPRVFFPFSNPWIVGILLLLAVLLTGTGLRMYYAHGRGDRGSRE